MLAWDTGPANCLLDVAAARVTDGRQTRDDDGRLAVAGTVVTSLLDQLLEHPHFTLAPPVSTSLEAFSAGYLDDVLDRHGEVSGPDLLATLTELTAHSVARALRPHGVMGVVVSGGGVHNPALMAALRRRLDGVRVVVSDELGIPADAKEAVMWALLGFLTWHGVPAPPSPRGPTRRAYSVASPPGGASPPAAARERLPQAAQAPPRAGAGRSAMTRKLGVSAALVDGDLVPGDVSLDGDVVAAVGLPPAPGGRIAAPGLVDLQVNGFAGVDLMSADVDQMLALATALPTYGVTAFLPTLITAAATDTDRALDRLTEAFRGSSAGAARSLGVHLEGPYLSPRRLGTHPPEHRRDPDPDELAAWRRRADVVAVTIAPELAGAVPLVKSLAADGVLVSLGHSDATAHEAGVAFDAGARTVTHLFNAMSPLHHREPGSPVPPSPGPTSWSSSCSTGTTWRPRWSGSSGPPPGAASSWSPTRRPRPAAPTGGSPWATWPSTSPTVRSATAPARWPAAP